MRKSCFLQTMHSGLKGIFLKIAFGAIVVALPQSAMAEMPAIAPLGFKIGQDDYYSIKEKWTHKILLQDLSANQFTGGKVLEAQAPEYLGAKGLEKLRLIFNPQGTLTAVSMNIQKSGDHSEDGAYAGFLDVYDILTQKYRLISKDFSSKKPMMRADFKANDVFIQMLAPRNQTLFEVRYLSQEFIDRRNQILETRNYAQEVAEFQTPKNPLTLY